MSVEVYIEASILAVVGSSEHFTTMPYTAFDVVRGSGKKKL